MNPNTPRLAREGCEVALIGDATDNSFVLLEVLTQTLVRTYKGNSCPDRRATTLLGKDYLVAGSSKPLIHVWNWYKVCERSLTPLDIVAELLALSKYARTRTFLCAESVGASGLPFTLQWLAGRYRKEDC